MGKKPVVGLVVGAVLLIGAAAGFVLVPEHKPGFSCLSYVLEGSRCTNGTSSGWSHTSYDSLRVATWALLIAGVLLVAVGLINHARR